ncbi:MAG: gamma-glutamyltransferase family protein [Firmicutes bacterium]|nr:gamma-glutamyltransferase family protein [Bacillota bacterium]
MKPEYTFQKYPSTRQVVYSNKGIVCTSSHIAAQVGADIMRKGGNAIDAAIATAAALTVAEPVANGIGSDAFALVWVKDQLHGLNASGPAPMTISVEEVKKRGYEKMPADGWLPVTVPGAPGAWAALSERFGRLPFEQLIEPAIRIAREGYPLHTTTAILWKRGHERFSKCQGDEFQAWFDTFTPGGVIPGAGDVWKSEDHAVTLEKIAATKAESFYRGELADIIDEASRAQGGYLRKEDLAAFYPEWVEPISTNYKGYDVCEIPPNGHGITALMALNIFENFESKSRDDVDTMHKLIESMKLAFEDAKEYVTDPRYMKVTSSQMLNKDYAKKRAALIGDEAILPKPGQPDCGGTVYLCAADNEGNMISYIQSNYQGFGSGIVVPGTGIALQNRGNNFYLDPSHPNCVEGGKKSYHTIIPGFLMKDGKAVGPFGVMGGFMQPQGHVQVITNTIDFGLNPQDALDAPRWMWVGGKDVEVEMNFPAAIAQELKARGHNIIVRPESITFGRGQIIWRMDNGVLCAGTESRCDGSAVVV